MSKISIITINYNNLEGLKKTVESVISQTWQEFEYIVIDGGSTDGSADYLESQKEYIDYWVSEGDKGIYNAMNKGILKAKGEYLLFLNSGDTLIDTMVLEKAKESFVSEDSFICGNLHYELEGKSILKEHPEQMTFSYLTAKTVYHPSTFIKRILFDEYGLYNEDNKIISDWEFFFKVLGLNGESYKKINLTITNFDMTGISSTQLPMVIDEKNKVFAKYLPYIHNNSKDSYIFDKFRETNKRFRYLQAIDDSPFFRKIVTLQLSIVHAIMKFFTKK